MRPLCDLPLILADIPLPAVDWLRQAGVPVWDWLANGDVAATPFSRTQTSETTAGTADRPVAPPGRFVLYDSRRPSAQLTSQYCRRRGLTRIDVARLIYDVPAGCIAGPYRHAGNSPDSQDTAGNPSRSTFLNRLKTIIEQSGGVWGRVADCPFPYQSLLCLDGRLDGRQTLALPVPGTTASPQRSRELLEQHAQDGRPLTLSQLPGTHSANLPALAQRYPLMWQVTTDEFNDWWQQRAQVRLCVTRTEHGVRQDASRLPVDRTAVLELWRGSHVAWLPMSAGASTLELSGIAFQKQTSRHPAGMTTIWPDGCGHSSPAAWQAARRRPAV